MDPKEVEKMINSALAEGLKSGLGEFRQYFTEQLKPITEKLAEFEAVAPTTAAEPVVEPVKETATDQVATPANPETKILMDRLAKLEKDEQARVAELRKMKFDGALAASVEKHGPLYPELVREVLATRYSKEAIEKDNDWYVPGGKKLVEEVEAFFKSDSGQHFLPNPASQSLGTKTAQNPAAGAKTAKDITSDEMLKDWQL